MRALNKVQFRLQLPAFVLHLLMMGVGWCLVELNDHVHGAVAMDGKLAEVGGDLAVMLRKGGGAAQQWQSGRQKAQGPQGPAVLVLDLAGGGCVFGSHVGLSNFLSASIVCLTRARSSSRVSHGGRPGPATGGRRRRLQTPRPN